MRQVRLDRTPVGARQRAEVAPSEPVSTLDSAPGVHGRATTTERTSTGLIDYATYFDRHYLTRGLALHQSLIRHSPPFRLWVLCLDEETYRTLEKLRLEHVRLVSLAELEAADPDLRDTKSNRAPLEFYWTCTAAFLAHLFERQPEIQALTYLDADLFFFGDPTPLYRELGDGAILLTERRLSPAGYRASKSKTRYNVGLLVFRRTAEGLACVRRWREQCIEWCYDRVEPGRFGDQGYLEAWPDRYAGVVISQHHGTAVGTYGLGGYRFAYRDGAVWIDDDPLVYYHFSRLRIVTPWLIDPGAWRSGETISPFVRRHIYVPYARALWAARAMVHAVGGRVAAVDSVRSEQGKLTLLRQMARHRSGLLVAGRFAL